MDLVNEYLRAVAALLPKMQRDDIIAELRQASRSERQGRLIDSDSDASMERKKREGYF